MLFIKLPLLNEIPPFDSPEELCFTCVTKSQSVHKMTPFLATDGSFFYIAEHIEGAPANIWTHQDLAFARNQLKRKNAAIFFKHPDDLYEKITD
ncbi:hypothetical protein JZO70_08455 [Enterococcus sp. 669A]|uniref:Uncharacterized protein n=1 Tax=Candidatus Enterococcus moelleringii TaxID=2815325 RepID=A0ABS3L987_9ENTE|nr:hypothetical protein [Enterococcus sp. 669A]MBO1306189.1 hypothetical protein [Enterococcus sp. 669A]